MDYYYPVEEEVVQHHHQHPGLLAAQLPWQWQWRLFSLLSSPAAAAVAAQQQQQTRRPASHVSWEETAAAHLFSASLPGK